MTVKPVLLGWLLRPLWLITMIGAVITTLWASFSRAPLFEAGWLPLAGAFVHSMLAASCLYWGWGRTGSFGFLQSRGYTANTLWAHRLLAAGISAIMVWLPVIVLTFTPLRSWLQGDVFENPYYPIMVPRDRLAVLQWLAFYVFLIPATHYAWIRQGQPARFPGAGHWLLGAMPVWLYAIFRFVGHGGRPPLFLVVSLVLLGVIMTLILLFAGRKLNQTLELA